MHFIPRILVAGTSCLTLITSNSFAETSLSFDQIATEHSELLSSDGDTTMSAALATQDCIILADGKLGPGHMSWGDKNQKSTLHAESMGHITYARCAGDKEITLLKTIRVEQKHSKGTQSVVLSNELRDPGPADENGISYGDLPKHKERAETFYAAWRTEDSQQYVLRLHNTSDRDEAMTFLQPFALHLSEALGAS